MRTDRSLARRAAAGDKAAFEAIFRRYHQDIYRYCRAILRSEDDARDAMQSTMAAALRSLPGEDREIALKPWLFRVAHNEAISIQRARQPLVDPHTAPEEQVPGVDSQLGERERLRQLVDDLGVLPERQRAAIVMRELNDLSFAEIAAVQDSSEAAVRQTLYEARSALADMEEGRALDCVEVRQALSDGDRRRLRGRRLRAHLRSCEGCAAYERAMTTRSADLKLLCPPLPAAIGAGVLATVVAGHGGGAAGVGLGTAAGGAAGAAGAGSAAGGTGLIGGGLAASGAVKAASVVAAVAIGAGTADATGVVHLPLLHHGTSSPRTTSAPSGSTTPASPASSTDRNRQSARGKAAANGRHSKPTPHEGAGHGAGSKGGKPHPASGHGSRGVNGQGSGAAADGGSGSNGRAVGHTGASGSQGNSADAGANGATHSTQGSSNGRHNGGGSSNAGGSSSSHGANAGGSAQSALAPGHTKPAGSPASPPSNGGGGSGVTHGNAADSAVTHGNGAAHGRGTADPAP